jgi:hypothetical protein
MMTRSSISKKKKKQFFQENWLQKFHHHAHSPTLVQQFLLFFLDSFNLQLGGFKAIDATYNNWANSTTNLYFHSLFNCDWLLSRGASATFEYVAFEANSLFIAK